MNVLITRNVKRFEINLSPSRILFKLQCYVPSESKCICFKQIIREIHFLSLARTGWRLLYDIVTFNLSRWSIQRCFFLFFVSKKKNLNCFILFSNLHDNCMKYYITLIWLSKLLQQIWDWLIFRKNVIIIICYTDVFQIWNVNSH